MKYIYTFIFFFCFTYFASESFGQGGEKTFTYYTTANGLPTNYIYACKEDSKGFLWIATESGLVRFDGQNFVTYNNKNGLPDVEVLDLAVDNEDKVWMNLFRFNPSYYDPVLNRVIDSKKNSYLKKNFGGNVRINTLDDGSVSYSGINALVFKNTTSIFQFLNTKYEISGLWQNEKGFAASYAYGFLQLAANNGGIIDSIRLFPWYTGFTPIIRTHKDNTWFYNSITDSLYLFTDINFKNHTYNKKVVRTPEPLRQMNAGKHYVWAIAKSGAFYMLDKQTLEPADKLPLEVKNANRVYEDRHGNFWVTTVDKGLIKISSPTIQSFFIPDGFTERNFLSICRTGNKIFAGNYRGDIVETDGKQFIIRQALSGSTAWIRQLLPTRKGLLSVSENGVYTNFVNPVLTQAGTVQMSSKNGCLLNDSFLLIANHGGLTLNNLYGNDRSKSVFKKSKRTTAVAVCNNQIYFGSNDGLYKWIEEDSALSLAVKNDLFASRITWLHSSKDNLLWAGTASEGLLIMNNDFLLAQIGNDNYLASNSIRHIHSEKPGTVWVATNKGISAIDYSFNGKTFQYSIRNIGVADGLLSPQVNAVWVENDTVYAATANGINYFPANISPPQNKLQVFITGFSLNGRDTSLISRLSFPHRYKNITLHFAAPEINGSSVSYQYNINNAGWQNNDNGLLELPQLIPGHYTISFRAIDANGKASSITSDFSFIIRPAWWQTWWFFVLAIVAISSLLLFLLQRRNRVIRNRALEKIVASQRLTDLELQAVKAQINPHFVFNCLNSIKSLIHQQRYDEADKYLDNFSYLLRSTIDHSSQKMIALADEIKYIENYLRLEQLRFGKKLSYKTDTVGIDTKKIAVPSMLLQPYVENAIKHGIRNLTDGNGLVNIDFTQTGNILSCRIDDNGVGREAAEKINAANINYHSSAGLSLTGKREELFGISCHFVDKKNDNGKSIGTTVVLDIPLHYI